MIRASLAVVFGILAVAFELPAVGLLFRPWSESAIYLAPFAHVIAAINCKVASWLWNQNPNVDHDAVLWTAVFVPVFGPCFAWLFPRRHGREDVMDAHAAFEELDAQGQLGDAGDAIMPESWEHEADEMTPMSFAEILRHGSTDHKRNAVARLADTGLPHHLRLLREVLVSETGELQRCAFIELDRVSKRYESEITDVRNRIADDPDDLSLLVTLGEAHRELATSGLLDSGMERYHLKQAMTHVQKAWKANPGCANAARVRASILCDVGEFESATDCLAQLDEVARGDVGVRMARARIAYNTRDFATLRLEANVIARMGEELPEWLQCFEAMEELVR